jgi:hypothetical protein
MADQSIARAEIPFLRETAEPVREMLAASVELADFLRNAGTLTLNERKLLVDQALVLFEQNYAHLPFKVAMHAVNPLQRLRLLHSRLERQTAATMDTEWQFHAAMSEIFHAVRDLHTNYLLPAPFAGKIAYLPFLIEEYQDGSEAHYVVSRVVQGFTAPAFGPGAEITHWSGIPIARAIDLNGARFAGSNVAARHARGVDSLTIRALRIHLPPDEQWVTVSYIGLDGTARELREKWLVVDNLPPFATDANTVTANAAALGLDLGADEVGRAKRLLFAPQSVAQERAVRATGVLPSVALGAADLPTSMPGVFRARSVTTASGLFGHIRIFTFNVDDPQAFVDEFVRLIGLLPQNGLIVDVRGNGGGHIFASEFTLQTLTPHHITPEPVQFINSPLNLRLCRKHKDNPAGIDLGPWFPSMDQALETGATFSGAFPITPEDEANALGQGYNGPVILITDARCYSATDIFAAGFQDHHIGPILGVDNNTGAGGANVWTQSLLKQLLEIPTPEADSPYKELPKGAGMRVSIRRTLRVGPLAGTPVEDLGITPDMLHRLTRNDVLSDNIDLLERAGQLVAALPVRTLMVTVTASTGGTLTLQLQVANLDRADVFVDRRPRASIDLTGPQATVTINGVPGATSVRVEGYATGQLVAVRTVAV